MFPRCLAGIALLGTALADIATAQEVELDVSPPGVYLGAIEFIDASAVRERELAEDLEIFRRILTGALDDLYEPKLARLVEPKPAGSFGGMPGAPGMSGRASRPNDPPPVKRAVLATWIAGTGAVFQLEAAPPAPPPKPAAATADGRCPFLSKSKWERTQLELTGDIRKIDCRKCHARQPATELGSTHKADGDVKVNYSKFLTVELTRVGVKPAPTREELVEGLLDLLAENGRHFGTLDADETVTIAVTFRRPEPPPEKDKDGDPMGEPGSSGFGGFGMGGAVPGAMSGEAFGGGFGMMMSGMPATEPWRKEELTGDLALRQRDWERALEAFAKALNELDALETVESASGKEREVIRLDIPKAHRDDVKRIALKAAQAALGAGMVNLARESLDRIARLDENRKDETPDGPAKLPARLVVSAPKSALDAVAAGKLSRDEFRKQARVEFLDPQR